MHMHLSRDHQLEGAGGDLSGAASIDDVGDLSGAAAGASGDLAGVESP